MNSKGVYVLLVPSAGGHRALPDVHVDRVALGVEGKALPASPWFYRSAACAGVVAVECGWIATEVGRQPWIVYQNMRVAKAVTSTRSTELEELTDAELLGGSGTDGGSTARGG